MNLTVYVDFLLSVLLQMFSLQTNHMNFMTASWDHAVNSKDRLQSALTSDRKMIEADVITGHLNDESEVEGEKTDRIPIMGHPPAITSDLSLKEFLDTWKHSDKILKLDFKSTEAFTLAIPIMENAFKDIPPDRMPWLNADILAGPGPGDGPEVEADIFLEESTKNFPDSMLSLGWTTKRNDYEMYSENYINNMVDILFKMKYMKPVTYAVRASFAVNSIPELQFLLETSPAGSTLTIWSNDSRDIINYPKLVQLIKTVGVNRVYLDLPDNVSKTFSEMYTASGVGRNSIGVQSLFLASIFAIKNIFL